MTNSIPFSAIFRGFIRKQGARPKNTPITNIGVPSIALNPLRKKRGCSTKGKTRITLPREIIETIIHPKTGWLPIFLLPTTEQAPTNANMLIKAQKNGLLRYGFILSSLFINAAVHLAQGPSKDWLNKNYPARYSKVISKIKDCHGGQLNDSRYKIRMKGEGKMAKLIEDQFKLAVKKYLPKEGPSPLDRTIYLRHRDPQGTLF